MRIMVVEDDKDIQAILSEYLKEYGNVEFANDGVEAVSKFNSGLDENNPFSLICLDVMMPKMDGQEALRLIRDSEKERKIEWVYGVKIIMLTGLADSMNKVKAYTKYADSYLVKPVSPTQLQTEVEVLGFNKISASDKLVDKNYTMQKCLDQHQIN